MENFLELDGTNGTNGTNKTNGTIFELRVGVYTTENGTDAAEREQRLLADFAEPQGRKACVAGLKRKTKKAKAHPIKRPTGAPPLRAERPPL